LKKRGEDNGVEGLRMIGVDEIRNASRISKDLRR